MKKEIYKRNIGLANAYKLEYIETETEDKIIITAKLVYNKNSKLGMKRYDKAIEMNKLPLANVLRGVTREYKQEV